MTRRLPPAIERRSMWARTNSDFLMNLPAGWVATNGPVPWTADVGASPPVWWKGSDRAGGPIGPNGPWTNGANSLLPAVSRCTEIIVGSIVRAPWRLVDPQGNLHPRPLWLGDPMLLGRSPGVGAPLLPTSWRLDRLSFWTTWITHALWWGQGAFIFAEGYDLQPLAGSLFLLNPFLVSPTEDGRWRIDVEQPIETDPDGRIPGTNMRLCVLRGMPPNDCAVVSGAVTPEGVFTRHFQTLRIGAAVSKYVADLFSSGGVPSGFLKVSTPGLKKAEADALRSNWMQVHGAGPRSVAILNATVDYQPITMNPVDSAAADLLHASRTDVAHAFNLSSIWLDEGASGLTYQNASDRRRDLLDLTLAAPAGKVGAVLSSLLPYGWELTKDFTGFTQPTFEESIPVLASAVQAGLMTAQEARQRLGLAVDTGPDPTWRDNSPATKDAPEPPALDQAQQQEADNAQQ